MQILITSFQYLRKYWKQITGIICLLFVVGFIVYSVRTISENRLLVLKLNDSIATMKLERESGQLELQETRNYYDNMMNDMSDIYTQHDAQIDLIDANYEKIKIDMSAVRMRLYKSLVIKGTKEPTALTCDLAKAAGLGGCTQ